MVMNKVYFNYDVSSTPESNITSLGAIFTEWLNGFGDEVVTAVSHLGAISAGLGQLSLTGSELVEAVKGMAPQDLNDQAIDAMRKELAHLVADNARMTRLLKEESADVTGTDRGEGKAATGNDAA